MIKISLSKVAYGSMGLAVLLAAIAFFFMNPDQCPEAYTQAQVDTSNCIVGANIGLAIMLMLSATIAAISVALALISLVLRKGKGRI